MSDRRLSELKSQALHALQRLPERVVPDEQGHMPLPSTLLENLRVYQVELELQNDSLTRAEQKANIASQKYQQLFEFLPVPALVLSANGQIREDNNLAREWLAGCKPNALGDFRLTKCLSKSDRNRVIRALARCTDQQVQVVENLHLETPKPRHPSAGFGRTDFPPRVADAHCIKLSPTYHADPHFAVLLMDKSTALAREADRQLFQNLIDSSDDLIYATDTSGHITLANHAMLNAMSQPADQVLGRLASRLLADATQSKQPIPLDMSPPSEVPARDSLMRLHTSSVDDDRLFARHHFALKDRDGKWLGEACIARDITSTLKVHDMQQMSETVFLNAMEAIILTDHQTCIRRANPAFWRMSGLAPHEAIGKPTRILRSGHHDDAFYKAMWSDISSKGHWEGEIVNRQADSGETYSVWSTIAALHSPTGELSGYMAVQTDLTQLQKAQKQVQHMASFDALTDLPNRLLFQDRIGQLIHQATREGGVFTLLFIDLDHFKDVNDTLGHLVGDELLKVIANRLKAGVREGDTVARMGGDEFVILLPKARREQGLAVANTLQKALAEPVDLPNAPGYQPHASVGVASYPDDGQTSDLLLQHADTAMYAAKVSGRNRAHAYTAAMSEEAAQAFTLQSELAHALEEGQFRLYWQPKFRLTDLATMGAEALLRWDRPGCGIQTPDQFLAMAEKSGLMPAIDDWVLRQALSQVADWSTQNLWRSGLILGLNQTAQDLKRPGWGDQLERWLKQYHTPGTCLEIELTESTFASRSSEMQANLEKLTALGASLSIDDFGTGYSSLSYLKALPVSTIKIDKSFVRDMVEDANDRAVVEAVLAMAHKLGRKVVAEGIETDAQRKCLIEMGCAVGQGYLLSKPLPPAEFADRFLAANNA